MALKSLLHELFSPVIAVVSSAEADAITEQNDGLLLAELFRPFGTFQNLNSGVGVPVRTVGDTSYRVHSIQLRFYNAATLRPPASEVADDFLANVLSSSALKHRDDPLPDVPTLLKSGSPSVDTPWFSTYVAEMTRTLMFTDVQAVDQPLACLLVLPSTVEDPVTAFALLERTERSPLVASALHDAKCLKHYVLLHDHLTSTPTALKKAEDNLRSLKSAFGMTSSHLLQLHSPMEEAEGSSTKRETFWRQHMHTGIAGGGAGEPARRPPVPASGLGGVISGSDMAGLHQMVEELAVRCLLPSLEQRIRSLNHQVSSTRKGLRNQLKTLLWRKAQGSADGQQSASSVTYETGSVEWQMQQLAVLSFMVQDYDTCASTLRLLSSDYKQDKAWKYYAAAQELLGMAVYLSQGLTADVAMHLKDAFNKYSGAGPPNNTRQYVRHATRCMVFLAELDKEYGYWAEANYALMKAHYQEDNLRAALLLEQASFCLLRSYPPATRKFAFHMVLAGLRYNNSNQRVLSMRAYSQVQSIYSGRDWDLIEEHINDILGRQCRDAGDLQLAMHYFMSMLTCPNATLYWQQQYLQQFMDAVLAAGESMGEPPTLPLPLPHIDTGAVVSRSGGHMTYADESSRSVKEEVWKSMEALVLSASDANLNSWLDSGSTAGSRSNLSAMSNNANCCVCGETVLVDIVLNNPLRVPLHCGQIQIVAELRSKSDSTTSLESAATADKPVLVEAVSEDVNLAPQTKQSVALRVKPLAEGMLILYGVEWVLQGVARGRVDFKEQAKKNVTTNQRRPSALGLRSSDIPAGAIVLSVLPPMPQLEVSADNMNPSLMCGELCHMKMRLRNAGASPLQGIKLVLSSHDVIIAHSAAAQAEDMLKGVTDPPDAPSEVVGLHSCVVATRKGFQVATFNAALKLEPGDELLWPFVVHPRLPGQLSFQCVWYYVATNPTEALKNRLLRSSFNTFVTPSLSITPSLEACPHTTRSSLMFLRCNNAQHSGALHVRQITALSPPGAVGLRHLGDTEQDTQESLQSIACKTIIPPLHRANVLLYVDMPPEDAQIRPGETWLSPESAVVHQLYVNGKPSAAPVIASRNTTSGDGDATSQSREPDHGLRRVRLAESAASAAQRDVMVCWEAEDEGPSRRGVTFLYGLPSKDDSLVHVSVNADTRVKHNFAAASICCAVLSVSVRNGSSQLASVCVETGGHNNTGSPRSPTGGAARSPRSRNTRGASMGHIVFSELNEPPTYSDPLPCRDYVWCGSTHTNVTDVQPGHTETVQLQVAFFSPGVYELADYSLSWTFTGGSPHKSDLRHGPPVVITVEAE